MWPPVTWYLLLSVCSADPAIGLRRHGHRRIHVEAGLRGGRDRSRRRRAGARHEMALVRNLRWH